LVAEHLIEDPLDAVDVGAARGVPPHWRPFLGYLRVHAFEPDRAECERLAASSHPNISWHATALAREKGTRQLHVLATPTGSSLLPLDETFASLYGYPEYHRVVDSVDVECESLSTVIPDTRPALVKLDTQGSELEILDGLSSEQLDAILAVELEAEFHTAYAGQPLFPDVHRFMIDRGFDLFDLRTQRVHLTDGREERAFLKRHLRTAVGTKDLSAKLHSCDALYIRPFTAYAEQMTPTEFGRYATVLQMYHYYDVIFWLLTRPSARRAFGARQQEELTRAYEATAPTPSFSQRTGAVPHLYRRARRGLSYLLERVGYEPFDPPRVFWTQAYWPDQ